VVFLFALSFLLSGAAYFFAAQATSRAVANRASVVQLCQSGNESRAQQVNLWTHLIAISAPPPHQTAVQRAARDTLIRQFLAYVRTVFAPRDCAARFKG
jgi:hypothetical protein